MFILTDDLFEKQKAANENLMKKVTRHCFIKNFETETFGEFGGYSRIMPNALFGTCFILIKRYNNIRRGTVYDKIAAYNGR